LDSALAERLLEAPSDQMTSLLVMVEARFQFDFDFDTVELGLRLSSSAASILNKGLQDLTRLAEKNAQHNLQNHQTVRTLMTPGIALKTGKSAK
jgi:hypothetical protein